MSWEEVEIDDDAKVSDHGVLLVAKTGKYKAMKEHYYCVFRIGALLMQQLGWGEDTKVRFAWGTGPHKGMVRLIPVHIAGSSSWDVTVTKKGIGRVRNRKLPANVSKKDYSIAAEFAFADIAGSSGVKFLEIYLPDDFYQEGTEVEAKSKKRRMELVDTAPTTPLLAAPDKMSRLNEPVPGPTPAPTGGQATSGLTSVFSTSISKPIKDTTNLSAGRDWGPSLDITDLCRYITVEIGDTAKVVDARQVRINDKPFTYEQALVIANRNRVNNEKKGPFRLKTALV